VRPNGRSARAQRDVPDAEPIAKKNPPPRSLTARLDRAAGDMNAFLLVLAIGLATLDLTWPVGIQDARRPAGDGATTRRRRWQSISRRIKIRPSLQPRRASPGGSPRSQQI